MIVTHPVTHLPVTRTFPLAVAFALAILSGGNTAHAQAPTPAESGWTHLYSQTGGTNAATALSDDGQTLYWTQYYNGAASGVFKRRIDGVVTRLSALNYGSGLLPLADGSLLWSRITDGHVRRIGSDGVESTTPLITATTFHSGDSDTVGLDRAPAGFTNADLSVYPGDVVIAEVGVLSPPVDDAIYACSTSVANDCVRIVYGSTALVNPTDVAVTTTEIFVVDSGANKKLFRVDADGAVTAQIVNAADPSLINGRFRSVEWDPRDGTLLVAVDVAGELADTLVRLTPTTPATDEWYAEELLSGFDLYYLSESAADYAFQAVDLALGGRVLAVAAGGETHVYARCGSASPDCDSDGGLDVCDVLFDVVSTDRPTRDCNANGRLDFCDNQGGGDCDGDKIPDDCPDCRTLDLVFVMDTSTSMEDEGAVLCQRMGEITGALAYRGIEVRVARYAITGAIGGVFSCLDGTVVNRFGTELPSFGTAPFVRQPPAVLDPLAACPGGAEVGEEDWGRAIAVLADKYPWEADAIRMIVPLADEGPWCGDPVSNPGKDFIAATYAADVAQYKNVIVSPIIGSATTGGQPSAAVMAMAQLVSDATGGVTTGSNSSDRLVDQVVSAVRESCGVRNDCNGDKIPDDCQLANNDCNDNDIPDDCDVAELDCNDNRIVDSCEQPDCNNDNVPDSCPTCPPLDVVFLMDTSTSMNDEAEGLCNSITEVQAALERRGLQVATTFLAIDSQPATAAYACLWGNAKDWFGTAIPFTTDPDLTTFGSGCGGYQASSEDWGRAIALVASQNDWAVGHRRIIVPIADEGAWCGFDFPTIQWNAKDDKARDLAIAMSNLYSVYVAPILPATTYDAARPHLLQLAAETRGVAAELDEAGNTNNVRDAIIATLSGVCEAPDCDHDGVLDSCETDCNKNGVPDDCEGLADNVTPNPNGPDTCAANGVPDVCESWDDCAQSQRGPDACEIALGVHADSSPQNGVPDICEECQDNPSPCITTVFQIGVGCVDVINVGQTCTTDTNACTTQQCNADAQCVVTSTVFCNDNNVCTDDACNPDTGQCVYAPNNASCADDNLCNGVEACVQGQCVRTGAVICPSAGVCQVALGCDPDDGLCKYEDRPNGTTCNDNDKCSRTDTCQSGQCVGSNKIQCTALDQCHLPGVCDPGTGNCSNPNAPNGTTCVDDNLCTSASQCIDGLCGPKTYVNCDDNNVCTLDECDPNKGCVYTKTSGNACDDKNLCTQVDACSNGQCVGTNPKTCTALDECHLPGVCNPTTGVCDDPYAPIGKSCNDQQACTRPDTCDGRGNCVGIEVVCPAAPACKKANPCQSGECTLVNDDANSAGCDDGNPCTIDSCSNGACVNTPKPCGDDNVCTNDSCNPQTGQCVNAVQVGRLCNDGDACTPSSACDAAGLCVGEVPPNRCNDNNPCTDDSCDPDDNDGNPCQFVRDDTNNCTDGLACTTDHCEAGSCVNRPVECGSVVAAGGVPTTCPADSRCDVCFGPATCVEPSGACVEPYLDGTACDDGDTCTEDDRCYRGTCVGGIPQEVDCDDGNECTLDSWDCESGCSNEPVPGAPCNSDADLCTEGTCAVAGEIGFCDEPPTRPDCDDDNLCTNDYCDHATGECVNDPAPNIGDLCSDGDLCTDNDACDEQGDCVGLAITCEDDDSSDCWVPTGECDPTDGLCWYDVVEVGTACDDYDECTTGDKCDADGYCDYEEDVDCDDGNACTIDSCDTYWGCENDPAPDGVPCYDGLFCTEVAECIDGECTRVVEFDCDDEYDCTSEYCDSELDDCVYVDLDSNATVSYACDDYDECTTGDVCRQGYCEGEETVVCDGASDCQYEGWCYWLTGECVYEPIPDGSGCDDGSACTSVDTCKQGVCIPGRDVVCDDNDPCTVDTCGVDSCPPPEERQGGTVHGALAFDGGVLDAGWSVAQGQPGFTEGRMCVGAGSMVVLDATVPGHGYRVTATARFGAFGDDAQPGLLFFFSFATPTGPLLRLLGVAGDLSLVYGEPPERGIWREAMPSWYDGSLGDDEILVSHTSAGNGGFSIEIKRAGQSVFGPFVIEDLSLLDPEVIGLDLEGVGILSYGYPNGNETCIDDIVVDIDWAEECPAGCVFTPGNDGAPCDDGDICTLASECSAGECVGTVDRECDDDEMCTTDSCDPDVGCVFVDLPNGSECDDDDLCTTVDECFAGTCIGGEDVVCGQLDQCHVPGECNPSTGECSNPPAQDGTTCDDNDPCTVSDGCDKGECEGAPKACPAPAQCHGLGTCDAESGECEYAPLGAGALCNDGNACTRIDVCDGDGNCTGTAPIVCELGTDCRGPGSCDPQTGDCDGEPFAPGTTCSDDSNCTVGDACDGEGTCVSGSPRDCDDGDPCTYDECDPVTGCKHTPMPAGSLCNDDDACTLIDTCNAQGQCVGSTPLTCNDGKECTSDSCNAATGCVFANKANTETCNDGNLCTTVDKCDGQGACVGSGSLSCNDGNVCTSDSCDPSVGCKYTNATSATSCDDGSLCTTNDKCNGAGGCAGTPKVCDAAADDCHAPGTCNPADGVCSAGAALPNGSLCNDDNACTRVDTCQSGSCVGSSPIVCDATECRNAGACDPDTGTCGGTPKANGTACSDFNVCTLTDSCQNGSCIGTGSLSCDDGDPCTIDSCDARTGCTHTPAATGTACDDGNACTTASQCNAGKCVAVANLDCSDDDPCSVDRCDPTIGCVDEDAPNGTRCDDGNLCTQVDGCQAGACVGSFPVVCAASDQCHLAGACNPLTGQCSNPVAPPQTACNDGSVCTTGDRCQEGACVGSRLSCDDGDPCTLDGCDAALGCVNTEAPDNTPCSDADPCTTANACIDGSCVATSYLACDDQNPCTVDHCAAGVGCTTEPADDGLPCSDDDLCTSGDACLGGVCAGSGAPCAERGECFAADGCNAQTGACEYLELPGDIPVPIGVIAIGTLGGPESRATAIDERGNVAGDSDVVGGGRRHAFLWQDGALTDLTPAATRAESRGLEDGVVAGVLEDADGRAAFRWKAGALERLWALTVSLGDARVLGPVGGAVAGVGLRNGQVSAFFAAAGSNAVVITPPANGSEVEPLALNVRGEVVGRFLASDGERHAFRWTAGGGLVDLGAPGEASVAHAIDAAGVIVGQRDGQAFVRDVNGAVSELGFLCDGGSPATCGRTSEALFVNDAGVVLGHAEAPSGGTVAFRWTRAGGMVALETLGGDGARAVALAQSGHAVGESTTDWGATHAVLWTASGERVALGSFAAASSSPVGVNALGQVAGVLDQGGKRRAFFWASERGLVDLGTLGGAEAEAADLDGSGRVVGWAEDAQGRQRAFVSEAPRTACVVCDDDRRPPEIACPVVFKPLECVRGGAEVFLGTPTVFDACGQEIEVSSDAPEVFPLGVTSVTFDAVDAAGNLASCATTVLVEDTAPPVVSCAESVQVSAVDGLCGATAELAVSAVDACDGEDELEIVMPDAGWLYPVGSSVAEVAAIDRAGNRATCRTVVEVSDPLPFAITCPETIELAAPADQCRYPNAVEATVQARCRESFTVRTSAEGFPIGTSTIGFSAVDGDGETAACETRLVVSDVTPPTVGCGTLPERLEPSAQPAVFVATASDACGATPVVSGVECVDAEGATVACDVRAEGAALIVGKLATGGYTLRWTVTATDASGNAESIDCELAARGQGDRDGDTIIDDIDNCPDDKNFDQADQDADGLGNVCDPEFTGITASGDGGCAGASGAWWLALVGLVLARVWGRRRGAE